MMNKVLIAGGSGLIGNRLTELLLEDGFKVAWLSRTLHKQEGVEVYEWNPHSGKMDVRALNNCDVIINLAGSSISKGRWTEEFKKKIISSRLDSASCILKSLAENENQVECIISSSAIGYYGDRKDELLSETSDQGTGFLAETSVLWEQAYSSASIRHVGFRIGVVLANDGGILKEMRLPLRFGICPILGDGEQYLSWIHIDDLCRQMIHAIKNKNMQGIYNAVSPEPVNMKVFMKELAKTFQPYCLSIPTPAFLLKLFLGEKSSLILNSARVNADKIMQSNFQFQFPQLKNALHALSKK